MSGYLWQVLLDGRPIGTVYRREARGFLPKFLGGTDAPRATLKEAVAHLVEVYARQRGAGKGSTDAQPG